MNLDTIDWAATLRAAHLRLQGQKLAQNGPAGRMLADAESLSALFCGDYTEAAGRIARARQAEPLNPVHWLRMVLLNLRFGQWDAALKVSQALQDALPGLALPHYLRGLATLRQEEFKRAANIAQDLITAHAGFAPARFLQAEANLRTLGKGVKKILVGLPKGPAHAAAWADLVIKLALSGSDEAAKLARQLADDDAIFPTSSHEPAAQTRVSDEPAAQARVSDEPAAQARVSDEPAAQARVSDEPAAQTRASDEPAAQARDSISRETRDEASAAIKTAAKSPQALARRFLELSDMTLESLEEQFVVAAEGSRAEEVVLLMMHDRLQQDAPETATARLHKLVERFPERRTLRRLYVSWLTRRAVAEAVEERYAAALGLVERCLAIEPHETAHYQNRAALFTLLREADSYHDAWFALNRHQYRLALLGKLTPTDALRLARPHRLFAQQARSSTEAQENFGIFKEIERAQEGDTVKAVVVHQERINDDPDVLRQWIHHQRAELVFCHWALGGDPARFLLQPESSRQAQARVEGMTLAARSLAVLVPEEGRLLAERMQAVWQAQLPELRTSYAAEVEDPELSTLQAQYLETLADLAVLCLSWQPDANRPQLVDEVLEFVQAAAPFFDERVLYRVLKEMSKQPSYPVRLLANFVEDALGLERGREHQLNWQQRGRVTDGLGCELLVSAAYRTYDALRGDDRVRQALALAERARKLNSDSIAAQLAAARFLLMSGYYDECRSALAIVQRSPRARDEQVAAQVDDMKKILDEQRKKADPGLHRDAPAETIPDSPHGDRLAILEQEIEKFPASIQGYEEIVRLLAAGGRFQEALDWSDRAVAHCLGREAQVRARAANLETVGLSELSSRDAGVVRLYLTGAHRPALDVLQAIPWAERTHALAYLLGQCLLAVNRPQEAQQAFEWALEKCPRQLHRAVLRRLASDIDQPYLLVSRRTIHDSLESGAFENALRAAIDMIAHLKRPELGLLDLARVHLGAALARAGLNAEPLPRPPTLDAGRWTSALTAVYTSSSDLERARRLANLSLEANPMNLNLDGDSTATKQAELLLQKINVLAEQTAIADALASSGDLLRRGRFEEALTALDGLKDSAEPRVVRQRALLLLKLERLEEADLLVESLRSSALPLAREFLAGYPALAYRQRMNVACRLIRAGDDTQALDILKPAQASNETEKIELGYCRAFCRTMAGYRHRRQGRNAEARPEFAAAMEDIEPLVATARAAGHTRLIELYETLDRELA